MPFFTSPLLPSLLAPIFHHCRFNFVKTNLLLCFGERERERERHFYGHQKKVSEFEQEKKNKN
jgi:hypothetical protein